MSEQNNGFLIYAESKISIKISGKAFHTLKSDFYSFNIATTKPVKAEKLPAKQINKIIKGFDIDMSTISKIKYDRSEYAKTFPIKLDKLSVRILETISPKVAKSFDGDPSLFVSALLEKYATFSYVERERIYYNDFIKEVLHAKASGEIVDLTYHGQNYSILPYDVRTDEWSSYNYLLGVEAENTKTMRCFRISFIDSVNIRSLRNDLRYIDPEQEDKIVRHINECGVMFFFSKPKTIKVKLTPEGKKLYDSIIFMRPPIHEGPKDDDDIYTFYCSEEQAMIYFRRLSKDAIIVSPASLRKKMAEEARKVWENYNN